MAGYPEGQYDPGRQPYADNATHATVAHGGQRVNAGCRSRPGYIKRPTELVHTYANAGATTSKASCACSGSFTDAHVQHSHRLIHHVPKTYMWYDVSLQPTFTKALSQRSIAKEAEQSAEHSHGKYLYRSAGTMLLLKLSH